MSENPRSSTMITTILGRSAERLVRARQRTREIEVRIDFMI
jgi:hypothetical protein